MICFGSITHWTYVYVRYMILQYVSEPAITAFYTKAASAGQILQDNLKTPPNH